MISLQITDATRRMGAPADWNHETDGICHTLEILDRDGVMISVWGLNEKERGKVAAGAPIILHIRGACHPVVALAVGDPPAEAGAFYV